MYDLILENGYCVFPDKVEKANIAIKDGIIKLITDHQITNPAKKVIDIRGKHIIPGVIDTQVHFRDPGFPDKETLRTGLTAALQGGVTCVFDMPNTKPATINSIELQKKIDTADQVNLIDSYFFIGATSDNLQDIIEAEKNPRCCGIKIFLGSSTGNLLLNDPRVLKQIFLNTKKPIAIHSEDEEILKERIEIRNNSKDPIDHPIWRNVESALSSTKMIINLARECNRKLHILHITTKEEMEFLNKNKDICTVEVTPQHLTLSSPECYQTLGTYAQMNPPIREKVHQDALWIGIENNTVDVIGSDHAPHTKEEKDKGYPKSPSGMPGVQTTLPVMLNHVNDKKLTLSRLVQLLCENPAKIYSLDKIGKIQEGFWANLNVLDLDQDWTINSSWIKYKCGWSPFNNKKIKGKISHTFFKGLEHKLS